MTTLTRNCIACGIAAFALFFVSASQWAMAVPVTDAYVVQTILVSSTRITRTDSDFTYRIKIVNQGGALQGAVATVTSRCAETEIRDGQVSLGNVAAGSTLTSTDTFTFRQYRQVLFNPSCLNWTIDAQPANTSPLANAGPDQTVRTGTLVTLNGAGSSDADGNPLTYQWQLTSRPQGSVAALSSATVARPTFNVDRGGTYVFQLVVNDGLVNSVADEVRISTINSTPVANAGADRTVPRASQVVLDGSLSSDPDFDALAFTWTIAAAPVGSTATLDNTSSMRPRITLDRPGSYTFSLSVSDSQLTSAADTVTISTDNSAPVANAGAEQTALLNAQVNLDGSASGDPDNDPISFSWNWQSLPSTSAAILNDANLPRPFFTADRAGLYVAQLIVNDGFTNSTPSTTTVTITVPPNRAPHAVADAASTPEGTPVVIDVLANDSDPDVAAVLSIAGFTQPASGGTVAAASGGLRFTPTSGFSGTAIFSYTVSDGELTATANVTVDVTTAANAAPVVNAGVDRVTDLPYATAVIALQFAGSVTDDGKPAPAHLSIGWSVVSGPGAVIFASPLTASTSAQFSGPGTYVLRLSASDGALTASDDVIVVVRAATNTGPSLAAIGNRTLALGDAFSVQLAADDSDPFDTLTFSLNSAPAGAALSSALLSWTGTQTGTFPFTVSVHDAAGLSDTKSFNVTVVAANRPPQLGALSDDTTSTGAHYNKALVASDPDNDVLSFDLLEGPTGMTLSGNTLSWQPGATQLGAFTVKVRVRDTAGGFDVGLFKITVGSVSGPIAHDDSYKVTVGQTITVPAPGVLTNDVSPIGTPLAAIKRSEPAVGTLSSFNADGSLVYTAPATYPKPPFTIVGKRIANTETLPQSAGLAPLLADLNRDGKPDLVYFSFSGPTLVTHALSGGDGHTLWTGIGGLDANACENNLAYASPGHALGDIDDDGQVELITIAGCRNVDSFDRIRAYRSDGSIKWLSAELTKPYFDVPCSIVGCPADATPTRVHYQLLFDASLSLARLAPGEAPVILSRQEIPANAGEVYTELSPGNLGYKDYGCRIITGVEADMGQACDVTLIISTVDGSVQQVLRSPLRPQFNRGSPISPYQRNPPITADLDGDGSVEIISGADVWKRVNNTWTLAWQSAAEPEQVAVADLDGDGRPEIIHALDRYQNLPPGTPYLDFEGILIFDANGQELRRIRLPNQFPGLLTIADIDGDHVPELLVTEAGNVHAIGTDGVFKWTYVVPDHAVYPVPSYLRTTYKTNIVVYDLDGDGNNEVIFSSSTGLHILEGRSGAVKAFFDGGTRYGGLHAANTTYVTDWDNDGHADIISFAEVPPLATEAFAYIITATNNDWLPAEKIHNQVAFQPSGVDEAGRVLFDPSVSRSYRNPRQLGTVLDPRATAGTSFDYAVNDGATDSAVAKVFLEIAPQNSPPVFTSRPPTAIQAQEPSPYVYQATAVDPDQGDTITYSLTAFGSNGLTGPSIYIDVNPNTGAVSIVRSAGFSAFDYRITITATDSQGATAIQSFVLRHENQPPVAVPDVVGSSLTQAAQTLIAASLQSTVLQEQFSAQPAGTVIAQSPLASSSQPLNTTVLLTVSKGVAPTIVPNVAGRSQTSATTALIAAGFTTTVTRQFSDTVEAGVVISQSVAAGSEQAGGAVGIVVSAGSGLDLQLSRSVTPSNEAIPFTLIARDVSGVVIGTPNVTMSIDADSATSGPMPTLAGNSITPSIATRGRYRLNISDGSKTVTALFVVLQPNTVTKPTQIAKFSQLDAVLGTMDTLLAEANAARLAGDTGVMTTKMIAWVNTWRSINLNRLSLAAPLAPEGGFPMEVEEIAALGVTQSTDDALNKIILSDASDDLLDIEEALQDPATQTVQIRNMFRAFNARADRIRSVSPGEYGVVDAKGLYAELLAHRIPRAIDALVEQVAHAFGLPPRAPRFPSIAQNDGGQNGSGTPNNLSMDSLWSRPLMASLAPPQGSFIAGQPAQAYVNLTLAEELTVTVVKELVDGIEVYTLRKFYIAAMKSVGWGAAVMVTAHHLKEFVGGSDPELSVTTGASFSINVFGAAYSTIEGLGLNGRHPSLNKVFVVGPSLPQAALDLLEKVKALGGLPSLAAGVARARDLDEMEKGMDDMQDLADDLLDAGQNFETALNNVYQDPHERSAVTDCLFVSGPLCRSIQYRNGFISVYKSLGLNLPEPILFVTVNTETGAALVGTPVFLPGH